jgi:hypothetical protein
MTQGTIRVNGMTIAEVSGLIVTPITRGKSKPGASMGDKLAAQIYAESECQILRIKMKENNSDNMEKIATSYECGGCGAFFESFERLRQHEVDCKDDDGVEPL